LDENIGIRNNMKNKAGWIYILVSSSDYSRCKIGRAVNPYKRYSDLRTADPNLGFLVGYYIPEEYTSVYPIHIIESVIHSELESYRVENFEDNKTEWFKINYEDAMLAVEENIFSMFNVDLTNSHSIFDERKIMKMYEEDVRNYFKPDNSQQDFIDDILNSR
tara:strand:- start:7438 stop:7923 length:486 start_codon:yes stop_codon:yes gene_type:complete